MNSKASFAFLGLLASVLFFVLAIIPGFVQAQAWSVSLSASDTSVPVGTSVTLTATASADVGSTIYFIRIYEGTVLLASCGFGTVCPFPTSPLFVTSATPTTRTFIAKIENFDGSDVQATSSPVSVTWTAVDTTPPIISVSHSPGDPTTAVPVTVNGFGTDSGSGMANVQVLVDLNHNGFFADAGENKICTAAGTPSLSCDHPLGLLAAGTYEYYATAADVAGNLSNSLPVKTFTVTPAGGGKLATPTLLVPTNTATGVSLTPVLDWGDVAGASIYHVQVRDGTTLVRDVFPTLSNTTVSPPLTSGTTYNWQVMACVTSSCGDPNDSDWTTPFTFSTVAATGAPVATLTLDFSEGPLTVLSGTTHTFLWGATNSPTSCTASGPSPWAGPKGISGPESITFTTSGPYSLSCTNGAGTGPADSVIVTVTAAGGAPTVDIKAGVPPGIPLADALTVPSGSTVTRSWTTTNSPTSCTSSGTWGVGPLNPAGGSNTVVLTGPLTATYTVTCSKVGFPDVTDTVIVTVSAPGAAAFTVGSVIPISASEGVATKFTAPVAMGGAFNVVSCTLNVDTVPAIGMVNESTGLSFMVSPCISPTTCTASASYTFPLGTAGLPHSAFVLCADNAAPPHTGTGAVQSITVTGTAPPCGMGPACTPPATCVSGVCTTPLPNCEGDPDPATSCQTSPCADVKLKPTTACMCVAPANACTAGGAPPVVIKFENPLKNVKSFPDLINNIINFLFTIAVIVAPILLVIAGVIFMTAAGDPTKVATARRMMLWTIVGFGIILISKGLVSVLKGILGI